MARKKGFMKSLKWWHFGAAAAALGGLALLGRKYIEDMDEEEGVTPSSAPSLRPVTAPSKKPKKKPKKKKPKKKSKKPKGMSLDDFIDATHEEMEGILEEFMDIQEMGMRAARDSDLRGFVQAKKRIDDLSLEVEGFAMMRRDDPLAAQAPDLIIEIDAFEDDMQGRIDEQLSSMRVSFAQVAAAQGLSRSGAAFVIEEEGDVPGFWFF